jgi:hypothetical protein
MRAPQCKILEPASETVGIAKTSASSGSAGRKNEAVAASVTVVDGVTGDSCALPGYGADPEAQHSEAPKSTIPDQLRDILETVPAELWPNHTDGDMSVDQLREMMQVVKRHLPAWIWKGESLEGARVSPVSIDSGAVRPTRRPPIRYGSEERKYIATKVREMLLAGIIRPDANDFGAPVVLAKKRDGSYRFCISFVELNKQLRSHAWPLPLSEQYFEVMGGATWFSSLDLTKSFFQIPLSDTDGGFDEEGRKIFSSQEMCTFSTCDGSYRFLRLPMGLKISSEVFQKVLDSVMVGVKWKSVCTFIDDLLVFSPSWEQHLVDVEEVVLRLENARLKISPSKTYLGRRKTEFLGFEVSAAGRTPSRHNVKAIRALKEPSSIKQVRSVLGLFNFYRRFIRNYSRRSRPLTSLCKKEHRNKRFSTLWGPAQKAAFAFLKQRLMEYPIMRHPDFTKPWFIMTDASDHAIGGVLEQEHDGRRYPVAYVSRTLRGAEVDEHIGYKELLAIAWSLTQWRSLLLHSRTAIAVETDHSALLRFLQKDARGKLARLQMILSDYNLRILFRKGTENGAADAFSRLFNAEDDGGISLDSVLPQDPANGEDLLVRPVAAPHRELCERVLQQGPVEVVTISAVTTRSRASRSAGAMEDSPDIRGQSDNQRQSDSRVVPSVPEGERAGGGDNVADMARPAPPANSSAAVDPKFLEGGHGPDLVLGASKARSMDEVLHVIDPVYEAPREAVRSGSVASQDRWWQSDASTIARMQSHDEFCRAKRDECKMGGSDFSLRGELLYKETKQGPRLVVPAVMRAELLTVGHDLQLSGHHGADKVLKRLQRRVFWPRMRRDVLAWVESCRACIQFKKNEHKRVGKTVPVTVGVPFGTVACDIFGPLRETSSGNTHILVVTDLFTNMMVLRPLRNLDAAQLLRSCLMA